MNFWGWAVIVLVAPVLVFMVVGLIRWVCESIRGRDWGTLAFCGWALAIIITVIGYVATGGER